MTHSHARRTSRVPGILLAWAILLAPHAACAQATHAVVVVVVDAQERPLAGASIVVRDGDGVREPAMTDARGRATVVVNAGAVVSARLGDTHSAEQPAPAAELRIVMPLRTIGSVQARAPARDAPRIDATSAAALLAGSVSGARSYAPELRGVAAGGSGSRMLQGVEIDLPGAPAAAASGVPANLLASLEPVRADDGSFTADERLPEPTLRPRLAATLAGGAFGARDATASYSATAGHLGYALTVAGGADDGRLAGARLLDASGVTYAHDTHGRHLEGALVAREHLRNLDLALVAVGARNHGNAIALDRPGPVLDGLGPGNTDAGTNGVAYLLLTRTRGRDTLHAIDVRYAGSGSYDRSNALFGGTPTPFAYGYRYAGSYDEIGIERAFPNDAVTISFGFARGASTGLTSGTAATSSNGRQSAILRLRHGTNRAGAGATLRVTRAQGAFATAPLSVAGYVARRLGAIDARIGFYGGPTQLIEASYAPTFGFAAPASADVTCDPPSATLSAPSQVGARSPHTRTLTASFARVDGRGDGIRLGGFAADVRDGLVQGDVAGSDALPPAALAALRERVGALCPNAAAAPLTVLLRRYETVPALRQREWYVAVQRHVGALVATASYETFADAPVALPPALDAVRSSFVRNGQLPGVPLRRAAATLSTRAGAVTLALGMRAVIGTDAQHLPAYALADAAVAAPLGRGALVASVQNLFGILTGRETSPLYAVPIPANGAPFATLATPLARTWRISYTVTAEPRARK